MIASNQNLICLHGFLGSPDDWNFLDPLTTKNKIILNKINLYSSFQVLKKSKKFLGDILPIVPNVQNILLGYSLGGRLALQLAQTHAHLFSGLILVSAHPGLSSTQEQKAREVADANWAMRFRNEAWSHLMASWNAQPVFCGHRMDYNECHYDRELLAQMLEDWSLAKQNLYAPQTLPQLLPALLMVGEHDERFVRMAEQMKRVWEKSELWVSSNSGHRVLQQDPTESMQVIAAFLEKIK